MTVYCHAIWDWNGTLLDDFEITARITIDALAELGVPGITEEQVREHYRRPLPDYFSSLLGHSVTADELRHLGQRYDSHYGARMHDLSLAADALTALKLIGAQATQSLLSMAPHDQIAALVDHHGLRPWFRTIDGYRGDGHPSKSESLVAHSLGLDLEPARICLIGDTVDDFEAASATGMGAILVATGMQSRTRLEATGAPVVASLRDAAALFLAR